MTKEIEKLQEIINNKNNKIVFFGGAGVSTESGIPDFRSVDGLYNQKWKYPPEEILSHRFFKKHTEEFFEFYREKMMCDTAKPNIAHLKLAELEKTGRLTTIVTQNIDKQEVRMSWSYMEAYIETIAKNVENFMILIISKKEMECHSACHAEG